MGPGLEERAGSQGEGRVSDPSPDSQVMNLLCKSNYIQEETHSFSESAEMKQLLIGFVPKRRAHVCCVLSLLCVCVRGGPPRSAVTLPSRGWLRAHARLLGSQTSLNPLGSG